MVDSVEYVMGVGSSQLSRQSSNKRVAAAGGSSRWHVSPVRSESSAAHKSARMNKPQPTTNAHLLISLLNFLLLRRLARLGSLRILSKSSKPVWRGQRGGGRRGPGHQSMHVQHQHSKRHIQPRSHARSAGWPAGRQKTNNEWPGQNTRPTAHQRPWRC